jgi:hypothetical protein
VPAIVPIHRAPGGLVRSPGRAMSDDEDLGDLPPPRDGERVAYGTLAGAVGRSAQGVAAGVEAGNVHLPSTAEHLELSLVRARGRTPAAPSRAAHMVHSRG